MSDRSVRVVLEAKVDGFINGMRSAQKATADLARSGAKNVEDLGKKHKSTFDNMGKAGLVMGGALALGVGAAVKTFADFDQAMSGVRANVSGTPAEMQKLEQSIRAAGKSSVFSSTESANAAEELAKAGLSASDIMGGALTGSLNLAAAGGIGLADAATISATTMQTFGLKAKDVGHIADVLAGGANASTASVESLSQGMAQGGLVAASLGLSLEDTVGTLAAFDQAGLKGSDAGTSLKTMLTALVNPSDQARAAMDDLGISVFDASGHFIGMQGLQDQLRTKMAGLTQEQRSQALATIFGSDAVRAANVLYADGTGKISDWSNKVNQSGTAAEVAAKRTDNLKGDLEKLKGALEDALISQGSGIGAGLRPIIQGLTSIIDLAGKVPGPIMAVGVSITGLGAAGLLAASGISKTIDAARDARDTYRDVSGSLSDLRKRYDESALAAGRFGKASRVALAAGSVVGVAAVAASLDEWSGSLTQADVNAGALSKTVAQLGTNTNLSGGAFDLFASGMGPFRDDVISSKDAIAELNDGAKAAFRDGGVWNDFKATLTGAGPVAGKFKDQIKQLDTALAGLVKSGKADQAKAAFDKILSGIDPDKREQVKAMFSAYNTAAASAGQTAAKTTPQVDALGRTMKDSAGKTKDAAKAAEVYKQKLDELGSALLGQRGSARDFQQSIDDGTAALKENGRTLDITTEKGRANQTALDGIASSSVKWAQSTFESTQSMQQAQAVLNTGSTAFVKLATSMGMPTSQAQALAAQLFKLPANVATSVTVPGVEDARFQVDKLGNIVLSLQGRKVTIPASAPNADQTARILLAIDSARASVDGKTVTIPTSALGAAGTTAAIANIDGVRRSADGKTVTIPTSALNAAGTTKFLNGITTAATTADGKVVVIPASTPNAAAVAKALQGISAAAVTADAKRVVIETSSPLSVENKRKIDALGSAAVSANGKTVTIDTSAPGATEAARQVRAALNAAHDKSVTIRINTIKTLSEVQGSPFFGGAATGGVGGGPYGLPGYAGGGATFDASTGGRIIGPGTGTSDSILAHGKTRDYRVATSEHVITAREVNQGGGHATWYEMRRLALQGRLQGVLAAGKLAGYAGGGPTDGLASRDWQPARSTAIRVGGPQTATLAAEDRALLTAVATQIAVPVRATFNVDGREIAKATAQGNRDRRI